MPVWIEVRQRLTETKCVEQYFAAQEKIEPLANTKYARNEWVIERFNGGLKGYFSVAVTGWKKLDDNRISYEAFIVHFRKLDGRPLTLTKIVERSGAKVIYAENLPN